MHIAIYNLIDHKVEFREEWDDANIGWNTDRLNAECIARNPQYTDPETGKAYDSGPWLLFGPSKVPFDWDLVDHQPTPEEKASAIRAQRNALLLSSDWTQVPDCTLSTTAKAAWKTYRQTLRDITKQTTFPESVDWPEAPRA